MNACRRALAALPLALVALTATWVAHGLEYLRLGGAAGLRSALAGSIHGYMVPAALALGASGALAAGVAWRGWRELGRRVAALRAAGATATRGGRAALRQLDPAVPAPKPSRLGSAGRLLILLGLQLTLYLLQENVEALRAGLSAPGLGAVLGVHLPVLLIHLDLAAAGAALLWAVSRAFRRRSAALRQAGAVVVRLLARLARHVPATPTPAARVPAVAWFGGTLWRRPPPHAV